MNQRRVLTVLILGTALLVLGFAGGGWWARHAAVPTPSSMNNQAVPAPAGQVLYWYDPMFPLQHFDQPGKSPFMNMELVPKYAGVGDETAGVRIDPAVLQNLGVRLASVTRIPLTTQIEATGAIGFNERDVAIVQTRSGGFVEHVWALAPGDRVTAGQPLVELRVPEWIAAQHELLAVKLSRDENLMAAARERLRSLGMPETLLQEVEHSSVPRARFRASAPIAGVVQSLEVRTGMTLTVGQTLARINGLDTVWLEVAVPEVYAGAVSVGSHAKVHLAGFPARAFDGHVTAILPVLNETTRTLRVRVELPNRDGTLRPGLSAQVTLISAQQESALAVPTEAIIRTGKRALVMRAEAPGRFLPVEVALGREVSDQTVITAGLSEGQKVVASGQFLIDSEASLQGIEARSVGERP